MMDGETCGKISIDLNMPPQIHNRSSCAIMHLQIFCVTDAYDHALAISSFSPSLTSSVVLLIICFPYVSHSAI